jgi:hypothetical protein
MVQSLLQKGDRIAIGKFIQNILSIIEMNAMNNHNTFIVHVELTAGKI